MIYRVPDRDKDGDGDRDEDGDGGKERGKGGRGEVEKENMNESISGSKRAGKKFVGFSESELRISDISSVLSRETSVVLNKELPENFYSRGLTQRQMHMGQQKVSVLLVRK